MKPKFYPNCSELIADFQMHDPMVMYMILKGLITRFGWETDPKLTLEFLFEMTQPIIEKDGYVNHLEMGILDKKGHETTLRYGSNGYDDLLGFRFDTACADYDTKQFKFLKGAADKAHAVIKVYDGGHDDEYNKWCKKHS
jgi:hypothetical protein